MLDGQLRAAYAGALDRSIHPDQVTSMQRTWLVERDACPDQACLSAAYIRQIDVLQAVSDEPAICSGASTPEVDACTKEYARRADSELDRYVAAARNRISAQIARGTGLGLTKDTLTAFDASQAVLLL